MRFLSLCLALAGAGTANAQESPPQHVIQVMGVGKVSTMPDIALIDYWAAGEGKTPDDASSALVARQKAIISGVNGLLGGAAQITNSELVVIAVRGLDCQKGNNYNQPRLDEGPCAIIGYLATIRGTIRTTQIGKVGTTVGLASQLGARDTRLLSFELRDRQSAYSAAMEKAVADARRQAATIAKAAGEKLGPILQLRDQNFRPAGDITASDIGVLTLSAPPPPPAPRAPIEIGINPRPIETNAQVYVSFAIAP